MNRELKDIIKLSGVKLDEEWANTPDVTNHPDQEEMGDLRDWGTNVELSLRKYLNHNLASPEFPQPITEEEMTASYKAFISEVHNEIVERADNEKTEEEKLKKALEVEKERVKNLKKAASDTPTHNEAVETEALTEAQSEAQKAAFEKMLAAKNGNKDDTVAHEQQHKDDTIEGKDKEEDKEEKIEEETTMTDKEEKVEETIDPYAGLYRMLTLAGLNPQHELDERGRASMGGGPGHRDPTMTSTAPGHAGSYGGGPESGPGDDEYGVQDAPKAWGTDYQADMARRQRERQERAADGGGPEGASDIPAKASVPQKGPWTKNKPVFTKAKRETGGRE